MLSLKYILGVLLCLSVLLKSVGLLLAREVALPIKPESDGKSDTLLVVNVEAKTALRLKAYPGNKFSLDEPRLNIKLRRLINFIKPGTIRGNEDLEELFIKINKLSQAEQVRLVTTLLGAGLSQKALQRIQRELVKRHLNFLWLNLEHITFVYGLKFLPLKIATSYTIQNNKVFNFYYQGKGLLTYVHSDNNNYLARTIYLPLFYSSQLYLTQVSYPLAKYQELGVYFKPRSNWNCRASYSRWHGAGEITWLRVLVLVNLPYGIIP